jgi:DNA-binding beta-propeller fold protein YncE
MSSVPTAPLRPAPRAILAPFFSMEAKTNSWWLRSFLYAAWALLLLLAPGLVWGVIPNSFQGVTTVVSTGSVTLGHIEAVELDSQGNLYIADVTNNQIVEVTAAGAASVLDFSGLTPALNFPAGIAVDESGNLFVTDNGNGRVVERSAVGVVSVVNTGTLNHPLGVALNAAGDLYIANNGANNIVKVPAGGAGAPLVITGLIPALNTPADVAFDLAGNLYIADLENDRIVVVAPGGAGTELPTTGVMLVGA